MAFDITAWDHVADFRGWPETERAFFSPRDKCVHDVIKQAALSAQHSIKVNMYGYDDDEIDSILYGKSVQDGFVFQMSLDKSQAGGAHEKLLLPHWYQTSVGTTIAIGNSVNHAISHLKVMVVDGLITISGSTNWSLSGEQKQDNELRVTVNADVARRYTYVLDLNHVEMLKQMAKKSA